MEKPVGWYTPETPWQWAEWSAEEVMGWETGKILPRFLPPRRRSPKEGVYCWKSKNGKVERLRTAWDPYSDLNHCREVEMKLKEMGLEEQYAIVLDNTVGLPDLLFPMITATAQQRLRAMWLVMKEKEKMK